MQILKSASKIVFILMAIATIFGMFIGRVDAKDFLNLASMAFACYFANQRSGTTSQKNQNIENRDSQTGEEDIK
mgnify:CR=1 FL=1